MSQSNPVDKLLMQEEAKSSSSSFHNIQLPKKEEWEFIKHISAISKEKKSSDPTHDSKRFILDTLIRKCGVERGKELFKIILMKSQRQQGDKSLNDKLSSHPQQQVMNQQSQSAPPNLEDPAKASHSTNIESLPPPTTAAKTGDDNQFQKKTVDAKKKGVGKKRKAQESGDSKNDSEIGGGGEKPPPAKKTKKTTAAKKEKKEPAKGRGKKKDGDNGAGGSATASSGTESSKKNEEDENGLIKSSFDEYFPGKGLFTSASEQVLNEASCNNEEQITTNNMRETFVDKKMRSVLSRGNSTEDSTPNFPPINATETASPLDKKVSVMDKKLLHDSKSQLLFKRVLSPRGMNYTAEAQSALADGIQCHFRSIIESAISAYHKRTNCKAMEHFKQMSNVMASAETVPSPSGSTSMTLHPGEVKPENRACYGMLFGDNIAERLAAECSSQKARVREARVAAEESLREQLTQADEMLKKVQKKSGKSEKHVDGEGNVVDGVPWWKREVWLWCDCCFIHT